MSVRIGAPEELKPELSVSARRSRATWAKLIKKVYDADPMCCPHCRSPMKNQSIILYNSRTITLTLAIYTFVTRGNYGYAAALATVLTALTIVSLLVFMRVSKSKEITF